MADHVSKKALQKSFHLSGNNRKAANKGCATKCYGEGKFEDDHHGNYRYHGYKETKSKPTKKSYYKPSSRRLKNFPLTRELQHGLKKKTWKKPVDPLTVPPGWDFDDKVKNARGHYNYKNANVPFAHQYHHMVPWEVLSSGVFTTEELKLLQKAGYCLHDGFNLIILPMRDRVAEILRMHTHPNNHKKYNLELEIIISQVKAALCFGDPGFHLTDKTAPKMRETLENWEKDEWEEIMSSGYKKYPDHVNEHEPSDMMPALADAMS